MRSDIPRGHTESDEIIRHGADGQGSELGIWIVSDMAILPPIVLAQRVIETANDAIPANAGVQDKPTNVQQTKGRGSSRP